MRKLWLRFNDINDYNNKYSLIGQLKDLFPGTDTGYAMLSDVKQRMPFSLTVTRQSEQEAKRLFGEENVAVVPAFEPEPVPEPILKPAPEPVPVSKPIIPEPVAIVNPSPISVQEIVSKTTAGLSDKEKEVLMETSEYKNLEKFLASEKAKSETTTISVENINMPIEVEEEGWYEGKNKDESLEEDIKGYQADQEMVKAVEEAAKIPIESVESEGVVQMPDNSEENPSEDVKAGKIDWKIPSEAGLEIFGKQWSILMKNTEKKAKEERKKDKTPNTELVMAQVKAMASIMEKAIAAWAKNTDFENQLKLPWKSVDRMIEYVREEAKKLAVNGITVLSGFAETEEELKTMAPFSFIYDYYMRDDRTQVEEEINKKVKEDADNAKKQVENGRRSLITKAKRNSSEILELAKRKARASLESSEEFKALTKMKQGKEVSKAAENFMNEARAEYTAKEEKRNVCEKILTAVKTDLADTVKKMKAAERDKTFEEEVNKRYEALSEAEKHPGIPEWTPEQFPEEYAKEQEEKKQKKKAPAESKDDTTDLTEKNMETCDSLKTETASSCGDCDNQCLEEKKPKDLVEQSDGQMSLFDMVCA